MAAAGWMTTKSGTVYVERGKGGSARREGANMREASAEDLPVVFFPEGTTSDGTGLLKFHSGLLAEALGSDQPVTAGCLSYSLNGGESSGARVAEDVAYWGDMSLPIHIFRFLGVRGVVAHVRIAEKPIRFSEGAVSRKAAAVEARCAVLELRRQQATGVEGALVQRDEECDALLQRGR